MQFRCNCCGSVSDVPQFGADGGAGCVEPSSPPTGWRTIWTVIEEATSDSGRASTSSGQVAHSCPDCNANMSVDEHHSAESTAREISMSCRTISPRAAPPSPREAPAPTLEELTSIPPPRPEYVGDPDRVDIGVGTMVRPSAEDQAAVDAALKPMCDHGVCMLPAGHEGPHDEILF
jgi:hypothetical protein